MLNSNRKTQKQYKNYKKPSWAPPSSLFGPVWTVLYIIITISFGSVFYSYLQGQIQFIILTPFILNLIFNFSFTYFQFKLKNMLVASVDIILTWLSIIYCMIAIFSFAPWVTYAQIPYLLWVSFATLLQLRIAYLNR